MKEALINFVKMFLKEKYPQKGEKEIQKMLDTIEKGKIEDWMWQKILEKMYEDGDADTLHDRIRDLLSQRSRQGADDPLMNTTKKLTREELNSQTITGSK